MDQVFLSHFDFSIYIRIKLYRRLYKGYCISGYFMRDLFSLTRTANSRKQKPTDVLFFPINVEKNISKHSMMIFWFQCYGFSFWFVINVVAFFYIQCFEVRSDCSFCLYRWNCWPSLIKLFFIVPRWPI